MTAPTSRFNFGLQRVLDLRQQREQAIAGRLNGKFFMDIKDAQLFALSPPSIPGLGTTSSQVRRLSPQR